MLAISVLVGTAESCSRLLSALTTHEGVVSGGHKMSLIIVFLSGLPSGEFKVQMPQPFLGDFAAKTRQLPHTAELSESGATSRRV